MKVKLDENLGSRGAEVLRAGGCEVVTVVEEDLCSAADSTLIEVSRAEGRVLGLAQTRTPNGRLWIVDDHRIREFTEDEEG